MKFGIIANFRKEEVIEIIPNLFDQLLKRNIHAVVTSDISEHIDIARFEFASFPSKELGRHCDLVLSLGGDGTILSAAKDVSPLGVPILGVNAGRFGFLTEISITELYDKLDDLIAGRFDIEDRMAIQAIIASERDQNGGNYLALNDVVLHKGGFARTRLIEVSVGDEYLNTYNADGIIISTPTGSSAYSLSAGGPLMAPDMEAILITPICTHTLSQRPLIIRDDLVVKIKVSSQNGEMFLSVDGQDVMTVPEGFIIQVKKAEQPVRLVKCSGNSFYQVLRTKLSWGELPINNHK
ncbi:MAG: NAD(+)/NADH kinase [bacterium]